MEYIHNIKKAICKGLEPFGEKSKIEDPREVEMIWKMVDIVKNIGKIDMMEGEGSSEARGGSYESRGGSYGYSERRRRDGMGRYSSDSYAENYSGEEYGRYSRAAAKDDIMKKLGELMEGAEPRDREALKEAMRTIERA